MSFRNWDPFGSRDVFASLWSSNPLAPMASGVASSYRTLFTTFRRLIVGRTVVARLADHEMTLTVTDLDSDLDLLGLSVGQFGDTEMVAKDVHYAHYQFPAVKAVFRNVHLRPGPQPRLKAAPVELELEVPSDVLGDLVRNRIPWLTAGVDKNGLARLEWMRRPALGHLEIDAEVVGTTLRLRPRAYVFRRRRFALPHRVLSHSVALPRLWNGTLITALDARPDAVLVSALMPTWSIDMPRRRWEDLIRQLGTSNGAFNLARYARCT